MWKGQILVNIHMISAADWKRGVSMIVYTDDVRDMCVYI
jgi:hypothetical protein